MLHPRRPLRSRCLFAFPLLLCACADGGTETRPESEVPISSNHHLLWFRSVPVLAQAATRPAAVNSGHAILAMANDSSYQLNVNGTTATVDRYALSNAGVLSIFNSGSGREPSTVFQGGYRLVGDEPDLFFTDRVSAGSSASIGLYVGTQVQTGQVELEGDWHVLSLHVMLQPPLLATARTVARAAHGALSVAAGAAGTARAISGTGMESGSDPAQVALTFGGSIQNLLDTGGEGDGSCNLTLSYDSGASDSRTFRAAAGTDLVLAVDEDETDTASGLAFLVRTFDAPTTTADPTRIAGDWLVGGFTAFVNPTNPGVDAFVGNLQLTPQGGFQLDAVGYQGIDFAYSGTWVAAADGGITLTVSGTNETWFAAVNRTYDTLALVDSVTEARANNLPELNLLLAVRRQEQ
ncbi:MAG: hypothetical protein AB7O97_20610 [Planctomycetota bacterium]